MIEIRSAAEIDADRIAEIGIKVWEGFVASCGEDVDHIREHVHGTFHDGSLGYWNTALIACIGDVVVGYGSREDMDFRVSYLYVDPDYGKKGVATALLVALERDIRNDGFGHAEVIAHARDIQAISFYRSNGYSVVSNEVRYSSTLVQDIEKVTMRKDFKCIVESELSSALSKPR